MNAWRCHEDNCPTRGEWQEGGRAEFDRHHASEHRSAR